MNLKKAILMASLLFLAGCEDLNGTLNVFTNFKAVTKNGSETISAGNYETSLNFKRDRVIVSLKTDSGKTQFTIKTSAGNTIPANGNFEVKSAESGQPFDVLGTSKTDESRSETRRGYENCQYQDVQTVCDQSGCHVVPVNRWGQQYTEYYLRTVTSDLLINMTAVGSPSNKLAKFAGRSTSNEKVIVQQTRCF